MKGRILCARQEGLDCLVRKCTLGRVLCPLALCLKLLLLFSLEFRLFSPVRCCIWRLLAKEQLKDNLIMEEPDY